MTNETYQINVIENPERPGELVLDLGDELCSRMGWKPGDRLDWRENPETGEWILTRIDDNDDQ